MYAIVVENLVKRYVVREGLRRKRVVEALRGISFRVVKGSIHALLGPNGAGKTTTVRILATLLLPDGGRAEVLGMDVVREADRVRRVEGVVLDVSRGFYMSLTGFENLVFYGLMKGLSFSDARRRAREVLELVGLEQLGASNRPYYTYSLGMRARLAIAKALMLDPPVFILDEPTLGLDVESARMVRNLITNLAREGRTVLITGHNMYEIELISHRVTIINRGKVVAEGEPEELKKRIGLLFKISAKIAGSNIDAFLRELSEKLSIVVDRRVVEEGAVRLEIYTRSDRVETVTNFFDVAKRLGVRILDFSIHEPSLEDAYIALLRGSSDEVERG